MHNREPEHVAELHLRHRKLEGKIRGDAGSLQPDIEFADQMGEVLFSRAASQAGDPGALDRAVDGRRQPEQARQVRIPLRYLPDLLMRYKSHLAGAERDYAVVHYLQHHRMQVDEVARNVHRSDLPLARAQRLAAGSEAGRDEATLLRPGAFHDELFARREGSGSSRKLTYDHDLVVAETIPTFETAQKSSRLNHGRRTYRSAGCSTPA